MKNFILFFIIFFVAVACEKSIVVDNPVVVEQNIKPVVENGYLSFSSPVAFNQLISSSSQSKIDLTNNWKTLEGFTSIKEAFESVPAENRASSKITKIDVPITLLGNIVNEKGLVKVGQFLMYFSSKYTKIHTKYTGSNQEINDLISATESSIEKGIEVRQVTNLSPDKHGSIANARSGDYSIHAEGNSLTYYDESYVPDNYAKVRGNVVAATTSLPVYCYDDSEPAMPFYYICGWNYVYDVQVTTDYYFENGGILYGAYSGVVVAISTNKYVGTNTYYPGYSYSLYTGSDFSGVTGTLIFSKTVDEGTSTVTINL